MNSLKPFELQQQIKENSQGLVNTINELHKWEKDIKRTSAANCQTKKNEVSFSIVILRKKKISSQPSFVNKIFSICLLLLLTHYL